MVPPELSRVLNAVHVAGTLALLPRAVWTNLSEPVNMYMRTKDAKAAVATLGAMLREVVRDGDWKNRAEVAQAIGLISDPFSDAGQISRISGNYGDSPALDAFLTDAQRRAALQGGFVFMRGLAQSVVSQPPASLAHLRARAEFRELAIPESQITGFAEWLLQTAKLPDVEDLGTPQGRLFSVAAMRLNQQTIQDVHKVDRPELASHPMGRAMYGLMSFQYAFWRNIVQRSVLATRRDAALAQQAGQTPTRAWAGATGDTLAHGTVYAGGIFLAALLATLAREAIFNGDRWDEEEKKGTLGEWLVGLAASRTGLTGPFDPILQAVKGLRYERDLAALAAGPGPGYFLQAAQGIISPFVARNSENTNTAEWNATKSVFQMLGVPALSALFTALPGGPLSGPALGLLMQSATSNQTASNVADAVMGEKDTRRSSRGAGY